MVPTPAERRALSFLSVVIALGVGVRSCSATPTPPQADREALARQIALVDSAMTAGGRRRARPRALLGAVHDPTAPSTRPRASVRPEKAPASPLDLDRADSAALDRLPGVGPALAARIVADRDSGGPFGSITGLERVRGIGPALAKRLQPHVTFFLPPRHSGTVPSLRERVPRP